MSNQSKYNFKGATFIHSQQIFGDHATMTINQFGSLLNDYPLIHPEAEKVKTFLFALYRTIAALPDQAAKDEALTGLTGMTKELAKAQPQQDKTTLVEYWQKVLHLLSITSDLASVTSLVYSLGQFLGLPLP